MTRFAMGISVFLFSLGWNSSAFASGGEACYRWLNSHPLLKNAGISINLTSGRINPSQNYKISPSPKPEVVFKEAFALDKKSKEFKKLQGLILTHARENDPYTLQTAQLFWHEDANRYNAAPSSIFITFIYDRNYDCSPLSQRFNLPVTQWQYDVETDACRFVSKNFHYVSDNRAFPSGSDSRLMRYWVSVNPKINKREDWVSNQTYKIALINLNNICFGKDNFSGRLGVFDSIANQRR